MQKIFLSRCIANVASNSPLAEPRMSWQVLYSKPRTDSLTFHFQIGPPSRLSTTFMDNFGGVHDYLNSDKMFSVA